MKALGISAIVATVISFFLWLINWAYWMYESFLPYDSARYEQQKMMRYVMQGVGAVSSLTEYLAILLIAICVVLMVKRLPRM